MARIPITREQLARVEELRLIIQLLFEFYEYVLQENLRSYFDPEEIIPAAALPPEERALVQKFLKPGYVLLGRIPYEESLPADLYPLRCETLTLSRPPSSDQARRRYVTIFYNSMKIPADGSTSNMEPKVFQLSDENHGTAVHTMFQNFREVSIRILLFCCISELLILIQFLGFRQKGQNFPFAKVSVLKFFVKLTSKNANKCHHHHHFPGKFESFLVIVFTEKYP